MNYNKKIFEKTLIPINIEDIRLDIIQDLINQRNKCIVFYRSTIKDEDKLVIFELIQYLNLQIMDYLNISDSKVLEDIRNINFSDLIRDRNLKNELMYETIKKLKYF